MPDPTVRRGPIPITAADVMALLTSGAEEPVLYLQRDDETGEHDDISVWAGAYVPHADVIAYRSQIADQVDTNTPADDETLTALLAELQETVDTILACG